MVCKRLPANQEIHPHSNACSKCLHIMAGPTNFGPTAEAATPWLALALYLALRAGPPSVVLVAGQRLWRLPPQLASCTHALLWPWDLDALRAQVCPGHLEHQVI